MANINFSPEKVVGELTVGHEIMTNLHSLLQEPTKVDEVREEYLSSNLSRVLKAFEVGISILKQDPESTDESAVSVKPGNGSSPKRSKSLDRGNSGAGDKKMRKCANSRTIASYSPFGDGYQWRKYGEKKIQNGVHSRTYYRCTNNGCSARKQVQQRDNSDDHMPLYNVTYNHDHTCGLAPDFTTLSLTPTPSKSEEVLRFDWNDSKPKNKHLLTSCSYQKSSYSEQILSPQSTDSGFSSVNLFQSDLTIAEPQSPVFSMPDSDNDQIDSISYNCLSPEGPWFDASEY